MLLTWASASLLLDSFILVDEGLFTEYRPDSNDYLVLLENCSQDMQIEAQHNRVEPADNVIDSDGNERMAVNRGDQLRNRNKQMDDPTIGSNPAVNKSND